MENFGQHDKGFILDGCFVYLGLTMPNLQKKHQLIFEIFNIKKCTLFFGTKYTYGQKLITGFGKITITYVTPFQTCQK